MQIFRQKYNLFIKYSCIIESKYKIINTEFSDHYNEFELTLIPKYPKMSKFI